ncbi:MAG: Ribosomal large subunit pseudouridine synthase B [uncultured Solirubrobacteraceae bacterium]|uniref:Pseudouridine synthase n=1 Tax=uncultured Solirubrobacteraceae bacterium TaxID=1162706 RepID=A0A6J4R5J9_9ACTN|nr:MAG: Ribosomal large subunit pseudouridine synthase B [uncultured Solirubrobacteraceae bacterium]
MRLAKYLAHAGVASRRAAERLIEQGRVRVDGDVVRDPARDVDEGVEVTFDGGRVTAAERAHVVFAVHKPAGVVSTARDPGGRPTVVDMVASASRLYPVGRLDAPTTGLILLTDDGDLAYRLTHPSFEVPKTYVAVVDRPPVGEPALRRLREGVELEDGMTAPARVRRLAPDTLELTIHEGRKRQVRRMCEEVGHPARSLRRVAFGPLRLGDLAEGAHRRLTRAEVERLRQAAAERAPRPAPPGGRTD